MRRKGAYAVIYTVEVSLNVSSCFLVYVVQIHNREEGRKEVTGSEFFNLGFFVPPRLRGSIKIAGKAGSTGSNGK